MGKLTISMAIFNSVLLNYQRVTMFFRREVSHRQIWESSGPRPLWGAVPRSANSSLRKAPPPRWHEVCPNLGSLGMGKNCPIWLLTYFVSLLFEIILCMYVCMYLCIYVSMYLSIYLSMYLCIYVSMYLCIYVCMYVSIYLCMYVCMYIYIYINIYLYLLYESY